MIRLYQCPLTWDPEIMVDYTFDKKYSWDFLVSVDSLNQLFIKDLLEIKKHSIEVLRDGKLVFMDFIPLCRLNSDNGYLEDDDFETYKGLRTSLLTNGYMKSMGSYRELRDDFDKMLKHMKDISSEVGYLRRVVGGNTAGSITISEERYSDLLRKEEALKLLLAKSTPTAPEKDIEL